MFTGRYANYTGADTWYFQGAPDGHQYSCWTDGEIDGFRCNSNIRAQATGQARFEGTDPLNHKIVNLGRLTAGANFYPCVSLIADGVFYIGVYSAFGDAGHYFKGFRYARDWNHFTDRPCRRSGRNWIAAGWTCRWRRRTSTPRPTSARRRANNPDPEAGKAFLLQYKLIWNSEAVSSGSARPYLNFLRNNDLPIPAISVEQANVADWPPGPGGAQVSGDVYTSVIITDSASPFAAGLSGTVSIAKEGVTSGTWHAPSALPEYAFGLLGTALNETTPAVYGVETGTDTGTYVHPARRVQMAMAGPGMVVNWNENGWAIFDAAVRWVLNLPAEPPRFNPLTREGNEVILSWTGGGTLQEAPAVTGPWTDSANQANPQRLPAAGTKFFRVRR